MTSSTLSTAGGDIGLSTEPLTDGWAAWPYLAEDFDGMEKKIFFNRANEECQLKVNNYKDRGHTK